VTISTTGTDFRPPVPADQRNENGPVRGPILIVDDEQKIRDLLRAYLERAGFSVLTTGSGADALEQVRRAAPALVVLDLGLPDVPGESVLREVRADGTTPVLVLTARASEEDRLAGLGLGADDYVTKPFSPQEVVLRVQAILRRAAHQAEPAHEGVLAFDHGALVIDTVRHEVRHEGKSVRLTPTEWRILLALAERPGRAFSRAELINRVQGYEYEGYERTVDAHVKNLRRKLERDARAPRLIETVAGVGYRFSAEADA
jgi:DNA-binding response OmpR family regulator